LQRFYRSAGPAVVVGRGSALTPRSVAACDLDGDGDLDLVSANESGHNLTAFLQKTPGSFGADPLVLSEPGTTVGVLSVAPADLDGDGDQDLASLVRTGRLVVFFQSSSGSFADPPLVLENPGRGFSVSVADMDGDGDLDLVSAIFDGLTIHHQLSPGSFAGSPLVLGDSETTDVPQSVATADLDADGDVDLVSANIDGNDLTVFLKTSPSSFSSFSLGGPGITVSPASITAEDLDGDGDLDLASANYNGNNLTAFFQLAPGSFASTPLTLGGPTTTNRPISVTAADFDGDGDQDLLSANDSGDNLTVFFQLAPGAFASTPLTLGGSATTNAPSSVAVADIDGDGDQDLLSANANGNNLTVFFGGR
jgi:hypothetical protein